MKLMAKNPFSRDYICTRGTGNQRPCVVKEEGIVFFFHGFKPIWIKKSSFLGLGDGERGVADAWRLRRSLGRPKPAFPRVRMVCSFLGIGTGTALGGNGGGVAMMGEEGDVGELGVGKEVQRASGGDWGSKE